jgi:hypothetical protein
MRPGRRISISLAGVFLGLGSACFAPAQETGHNADIEKEQHRFAIAGFIGGTHVNSDNELTLGLEGGFHIHDRWSIGAVIERADRDKHSTLTLVGVGWHPIGHAFRLQLGVGKKDPSGSTETVVRTGLAYEMEIDKGWFLKPSLALDFIDGEDNEGVFGLYIGRAF